MTDEITEFLEKNELGDYQGIFKSNKISFTQIRDINDQVLCHLIGPIGDQLRFKKAVSALTTEVNQISVSCETESGSGTIRCRDESDSVQNAILTAYKLECSNTVPENSVLFVDQFEYRNISEVVDTDIIQATEVRNRDDSVESLISNSTDNSEKENTQPNKRARIENTDSTAGSTFSARFEWNTIKTKEELQAFLTTSHDGRMVISTFQKNGKLNEFMRRKLTTVIVNHLMILHGGNLKNSDFKDLAQLIVELFPTEKVEAYYIPPYTEGNKQSISKGKLPYKHRNLKTSMKERGLGVPQSCPEPVPPKVVGALNLIPEQQFVESQGWLKSYSEPWTEVLERWAKTAPNRVSQFLKDPDLSISDILRDWPLFKHPLGYTLVMIDFKALYPQRDLEFLNNWPICKTKLISVLKERSRKDKYSRANQILDTLPPTVSEDGEDIVAMYLLPALLQPSVIRDKGKKPWKPTIAEAQEVFVLHAKDSVNKQVLLEQKKIKHQRLLRPIQPCVVIVGEAIHTAKDVYVVFENLEYKTSTILAAVDTCFKIFHVMNLEYPPEAYNTWMFIQRYFYKIIQQNEKVPTCVSSLLSDL